jgi:predicted exporter
MDMLPQAGQSGAAEADKILGDKNSREAIILAAAPDFESAKKGAVLLNAEFERSPGFESLSLYFDPPVIAEFAQYLYDYRFVIAGKRTLELLEAGKAEEIAFDALAAAYGAFNLVPLDNIDKDPFLLSERRMEEFLSSSLLSGGKLGLKDDVLAAGIDGTWYVLFRITLTPQAVSLRGAENAVRKIYAAAALVKETIPGLEFYFSGIPFHSYESSSNAQREISIISTFSLLIILAVFLCVFRSPLPIVLSILDAVISLALATGAALLVFREVHIITFVFGTSLIGTCVDYSVHFFIHWKGNSALKTGYEIRSHISKSIIISFISTEICFSVFLFAPFSILKQFAVFSMTGLLSSFLTSYCVYPFLRMPEEGKRKLRWAANFRSPSLPPAFRYCVILALAAAGLAVLFLSPQGMKIKNDISSLYTMSASLLESEKRAAQVLDQGSSPWYFIVRGSSPQETLENEERLCLRLEEEITRGNLGAFLGTSVFAPSIKRQKETYEAMKALLPLAASQFDYLGFPPEYAEIFYDEFAAGERFCLPENVPGRAGISNLWIGERKGIYYSCVLPLQSKDEAVFRAIAGEFDFVYFINKAKDISRDLDTLSRTIMLSFLAAYLAISVLVCFMYPRQDSIKICGVPVFLCISALAVLGLRNIPLGFFSIAALTLVFGLGLDYILYMTGGKHGNSGLTSLAIFLSFFTSVLSFGALGFSSFMPVHIFGLTVSAGLSAAFISAMLLQAKTD